MPNWIKRLFCKKHGPRLRYSGICKIGFVCEYCGHEWYEDRKYKKRT